MFIFLLPSGDKNYFNMFGPIYSHWQIPKTAYEDRIWKRWKFLPKAKIVPLFLKTLFLEPNTAQAHAPLV